MLCNRSYLCDQLVRLESVQLKQSPSWSRSLPCLISPTNTAAQCLLTCTLLGTGTFTTNRWLASEGKQMADLIRNQRRCLMGKIAGRWGQLANNGSVQGLKGRWLLTDGSLRVQEESNQVEEEDRNVGGRREEGQRHCYQADESLAWCQPDSAYTSTLTVALS